MITILIYLFIYLFYRYDDSAFENGVSKMVTYFENHFSVHGSLYTRLLMCHVIAVVIDVGSFIYLDFFMQVSKIIFQRFILRSLKDGIKCDILLVFVYLLQVNRTECQFLTLNVYFCIFPGKLYWIDIQFLSIPTKSREFL